MKPIHNWTPIHARIVNASAAATWAITVLLMSACNAPSPAKAQNLSPESNESRSTGAVVFRHIDSSPLAQAQPQPQDRLMTKTLMTCASPSQSRLEQAVRQTTQALKANDAQAFLSLIGSQGLTLGEGGRTFSREQLSASFKRHDEVYCGLFSCNGRSGEWRNAMISGSPSVELNLVRGRAFGKAMINPGRQGEAEMDFIYSASCTFELTALNRL